MAEEKWHDVGLGRGAPRAPGHARFGREPLRSPWSAATARSTPFPACATTSAGRWARAHRRRLRRVPVAPLAFPPRTGEGEPGFEADRVPRYACARSRTGACCSDPNAPHAAQQEPHAPHPLTRPSSASPGRSGWWASPPPPWIRRTPATRPPKSCWRRARPRADGARRRDPARSGSTSCSFRACEGYYSKSARACTWPCSITQMDPADQMDRVYEASCTGPTSSSWRRRSAGARPARSTSRWSSG